MLVKERVFSSWQSSYLTDTENYLNKTIEQIYEKYDEPALDKHPVNEILELLEGARESIAKAIALSTK